MGVRLEGRPVVRALRETVKKRVAKLKEAGITPTIEVIRVGEREDDISYERSILKSCKYLGIHGIVTQLPEDVSIEEVTSTIKKSNQNKEIHGIMIFRPLPEHLDPNIIRHVIDPIKDVDCMNPVNLRRVFEGNAKGNAPCTPVAVVELLKYYDIPLRGANVAMVGSSLVVGKPLAMLLLDEKATVTLCNSNTRDLPSITSKADITIVAIGRAKHLDDKYFNENSVVVDVGINYDEDGNICGDVDYDLVFDKVKAITPTLGGVGIITTTILLTHVVQACEVLSQN